MTILYSDIYNSPLLDGYLKLCDSVFQCNVKKYRNRKDFQLSVLGRLLLLKGLEIYKQNKKIDEVKYTKYGKPYFRNGNFFFNISHSADIVVCVVNDMFPVGIDIEKKEDIDLEDYFYILTPKEKGEIIKSPDGLTLFYNFWTQKEAILKALGIGLQMNLSSIHINNNQARIGNNIYHIKKVDIASDYICHIAYSNDIEIENMSLKIECQNII